MKVLGDRPLPEPGRPVGYGFLVENYKLQVPLPSRLALAVDRSRPVSDDEWLLVRPDRLPAWTLGAQLEFALRREGVNLSVLKALFQSVPADEIAEIVRSTPTGRHTRRLWFLYEWLMRKQLDLPDASKVASVPVVDPTLQIAIQNGRLSVRHRVVDNLPGTPEFCPMVRWSLRLSQFAGKRLADRAHSLTGTVRNDVLVRAAAFMLLKDSRSSFIIEGERPPHERIARWGQAIAQAGSRPLSIAEFERLQRVLVDPRFVELGLRREGGFVGEHDRDTQEPIPDHVSARAEDLRPLLEGLVAYDTRARSGQIDAVIAAAVVAFGFVYIHPFVDGNGRLHRWIIHHVLAASEFAPKNVVFPVSAAILREIVRYKIVLESYSRPLLPFIHWRPTEKGSVEVLNATADYYRFFDATNHAEFLYECVEQTVERDMPEEIAYLEGYDRFERGVQQIVDMPATTVDLLHRFLRQGDGTLSNRARTKEFSKLSDDEVAQIEDLFAAAHRRSTVASIQHDPRSDR